MNAVPDIVDDLVPWSGILPLRPLDSITTVVLHCTELPTLDDARRAAESSAAKSENGVGVCGHFYIDRDGFLVRYVPENRVAKHAHALNDRSIGIELVNRGRYPNWFAISSQTPTEPYTESQLLSLESLILDLRSNLSSLDQLVRHSDVDRRMVPATDNQRVSVRRRIDPGPLFPWTRIIKLWGEVASHRK